MASKHKCSNATTERTGKLKILEKQIYVVELFECGESAASVGRHFHINESSVRTIKLSRAAIRANAEANAPKNAKLTTLIIHCVCTVSTNKLDFLWYICT
jgi:hypothetical protein